MKLTQTPVFVASHRQESQVKFVSRLVCGQVLDLGPKHGQNTTCTKRQLVIFSLNRIKQVYFK